MCTGIYATDLKRRTKNIGEIRVNVDVILIPSRRIAGRVEIGGRPPDNY